LPVWFPPQLTQLTPVAPEGPEWLHEIKFDGYRMHAASTGKVRLQTRTGLDSHGGSQVKRIRSSVLRVSDPKSEPFVIRARLPGIVSNSQATIDGIGRAWWVPVAGKMVR
jgi:bifunctional non-homologous end joining protein LigD